MRDERDFTVDRAETFTNPMNHRRSQSFGSGGNSFSELNNNPSTVNRSSPLVNAVSPGVPIATRGLSENVHSISNNAINVPHPSRFSSAAVERLQRSSSMNMISSSGMAPNASRPQPIAFPPTNSSNTNINRSSAIADELYRSIVDEVVVQKEIAIDDDNQSFVSSISDSNSDDFVAPVRPPRTSRFNDNPQNLRMAEVSLDRNAAGPSRSGSRNQRPVQADPRIARLAQRAEEEAQLNRAILMSLQDPSPEQTSRVGNTSQLPSESDITMLTNMGFTRDQSVQALRESRNNVEMAANRLLGIN